MGLIRWILGRVILFIDWLTSPKSVVREPSLQQSIDAETSQLSLYQFQACPFCVKVRRTLKRHALKVELRDAKSNSEFRDELLAEGGQLKVPCLKINSDEGNVRWLYESDDIIQYLEKRFARV